MSARKVPANLVLTYSRLRSAMYAAEGAMLPLIEFLVKRERVRLPNDDPKTFAAARFALEKLFKRDAENIAAGLYPVDVLMPESPVRHFGRMPELFREGLALNVRKKNRNARQFDEAAQELLKDVPEYYRRNFHFQPDGYLSDKSARLYEHQVELLFGGGADAMRRLVIEPMKRAFAGSDGDGLSFLEIGAGTGRATRFMRLAFPKARITALDLSSPYLKRARKELSEFGRIDFVEGQGEKLPFKDELFDAAYSVFLFHELPMETRRAVLRESLRVVRPGGLIAAVDSIQTGDLPDLDPSLRSFPIEFHEPFYANYIAHPLEGLFSDSGASAVEADIGFLSKRVSARKPRST